MNDKTFYYDMPNYSLMLSDDDSTVDGEAYGNLDEARDIAFDVSAETGRPIAIREYFGFSENVIETVLA